MRFLSFLLRDKVALAALSNTPGIFKRGESRIRSLHEIQSILPSVTRCQRRGYISKIFLRHDVARSILARFLDSKGVPEDVVQKVVATKQYYSMYTDEFGRMEKVTTWLGTIGVHSGQDIGSILDRFPTMLWFDVNLLESKMQWFISELQFGRHEIGHLLSRNPNLLYHHAEVLGHFMQFATSQEIKVVELKDMIARDPIVFESCESLEELQSLVKWLRKTLKLTSKQCGRLFVKCPELLDPTNHRDMPLLFECLRRMGISGEHVGHIFAGHPRGSMRRAADFKCLVLSLKKSFQLRQREIANILRQWPPIMSMDSRDVNAAAIALTSQAKSLSSLRIKIKGDPKILTTLKYEN